MTLLLETRGLKKHFGGAHVINGIDFSIDAGEIRCVIGPNGAGKSTFFKLITGEHRPSEGRRDVSRSGHEPCAAARTHSHGHEHQVSDSRRVSRSERATAFATVAASREG
nr:ATP-binding cassette domain-containing protein [Candidatus Burkholderia verschuerenii]